MAPPAGAWSQSKCHGRGGGGENAAHHRGFLRGPLAPTFRRERGRRQGTSRLAVGHWTSSLPALVSCILFPPPSTPRGPPCHTEGHRTSFPHSPHPGMSVWSLGGRAGGAHLLSHSVACSCGQNFLFLGRSPRPSALSDTTPSLPQAPSQLSPMESACWEKAFLTEALGGVESTKSNR